MFSSTVYTYTICIHPINVLYGLLFHFYIVQDDPRFQCDSCYSIFILYVMFRRSLFALYWSSCYSIFILYVMFRRSLFALYWSSCYSILILYVMFRRSLFALYWSSCYSILILCVMFCRSFFVPLSFFVILLRVLVRFKDSDYPFDIFKLF
jgi:hypothetical protein